MSGNLRIAVVAASAPPCSAGGVAIAQYNLFRAMVAAGLQVKLFTFYDNARPKGELDGIVRHGIDPRLAEFIYSLVRLPFRLLQPKANSPETGVILRSALGALRMNRSIQDFNPDIVMLSDHGAPGLFVKKKPHQRFFWFSHHNPARFVNEPLIGQSSRLDTALALGLEQRAMKKVDHVICPSNYVMDWFHRAYSFSGPIELLPNLVDDNVIEPIPMHDPRVELGLSPEDALIYMPSAGNLIKGAQFLQGLVEGISGISKQRFGFYIPGHFEPDIAALLPRLRESVTIFTPGQIDYNRHIAIVKSCTFGISPALMENFSMAIVEAAFCGLPMLVFDRGGNRDIVTNGENGMLIPPFEISAMIEVAGRWLEDSNFAAYKQRAQAHTRREFGSDVVLQRYLEVLGVS